MTTFDERQRGYENKFAHDKEKEFKVLARRNKLLGHWAGKKLRLSAETIEKYSESLIEVVVQKDAEQVLRNKLQQDFVNAGVKVSAKSLEKEIEHLWHAAREQIETQV